MVEKHTTIQGLSPKVNDVFLERQKAEILGLFSEKGELCYSMLVKLGKDNNKSFVNNTGFMSLFNELLESGELVFVKTGTCPYTGRPAEFYTILERSLIIVETLKESASNLLKYMSEHNLYVLSQKDLEKLL